MRKQQNLDEAVDQEIEKSLPKRPKNEVEELDKAIAETKSKISEAFRQKVRASVKLTLSA